MNHQRYVTRSPVVNVEQLTRGMAAMPDALRRMGFSSLRPGQDQVTHSIMAGWDTIGILPTATGKTLCFAAPTMALGWRTLVFSPLISLMRDQEQSMQRKGVRAGAITSHNPALGDEYLRQWLRGDLDMLYVAPERLRREDFMQAMRLMPPDMVVCDESHALSAWSTTFRSAYCIIGDLISALNPKVVSAFSATLPRAAEADVRRVMCMENARRVIHYPRRTNLDLRSSPWESTFDLVTLLERNPGDAIIYCATQTRTEELASELSKMTGEEVGYYHGGLKPSQRSHTQDQFLSGEIKWMCATNAFGMGVDKADVRNVVHRDISGALEETSQETGRGGRDGLYTLCHTFFAPDSVRTRKYLIDLSSPSMDHVRQVYKLLADEASPDGTITTPVKDLMMARGLKHMMHVSDAALQVLIGAQVLDRSKTSDKTCSIRLKNRVDDRRLLDLMDVVERQGEEQPDGFSEIDLNELATGLDLAPTTARKRLNDLSKEGLIDFVPPDRTKPVKLIGSLSQVDSAKIDGLREMSLKRLDQVVHYATKVPDGEKHACLEDHLDIHKP